MRSRNRVRRGDAPRRAPAATTAREGRSLLTLGCPASVKTGPNTILLALCCWDARTYEAKRRVETSVLEQMTRDAERNADLTWIRSPAGLEEVLDYLDCQRVGDSRFVGALIAHRMAREMRARLPAK